MYSTKQFTLTMNNFDIYNPTFVRDLFNEMSRTYGLTNFISSFGFCQRWRNQCVAQIPLQPGMIVCDLMTGMGECWPPISTALQARGRLFALDFSPAMCRRAHANRTHLSPLEITLLEADVLSSSIANASVDGIISTFGLKTLNDEQKCTFAQEITRILKPGGFFSLLEISVPPNQILQIPYLFYLKRVIPIIGKLLLGNPDNYRMLGIYTEHFRSCQQFTSALRAAGLYANDRSFFFGCASGVCGYRPALQ
jgi:demethylmenaquinone methyltransferase/2-methoxy-6-polyprenyl-1,4-benzoquinol methylase